MREVIDIAIYTDSYDELIGLCQGFQKSIKSELLNDSHHITNPIISTRKERQPGRAKSTIEIQDSHIKKRRCLANIDTNIQSSNKDLQSNREKDTRKRFQKCGQRGHNHVTCKANISNSSNENMG